MEEGGAYSVEMILDGPIVSMRSSGGEAAFVESINSANLRQWYVSPFSFLFMSDPRGFSEEAKI